MYNWSKFRWVDFSKSENDISFWVRERVLYSKFNVLTQQKPCHMDTLKTEKNRNLHFYSWPSPLSLPLNHRSRIVAILPSSHSTYHYFTPPFINQGNSSSIRRFFLLSTLLQLLIVGSLTSRRPSPLLGACQSYKARTPNPQPLQP